MKAYKIGKLIGMLRSGYELSEEVNALIEELETQQEGVSNGAIKRAEKATAKRKAEVA